jgi:hypothetical protein
MQTEAQHSHVRILKWLALIIQARYSILAQTQTLSLPVLAKCQSV